MKYKATLEFCGITQVEDDFNTYEDARNWAEWAKLLRQNLTYKITTYKEKENE